MKSPFYAPKARFEPALVEAAGLGQVELLIRGQAAKYLAGISEQTIETALARLSELFDDWVTGDLDIADPRERRAVTLSLVRVADGEGNPVSDEESSKSWPWTISSPPLELFYRSEDEAVARRFEDLDLLWPGLLSILALGYLDAAGAARVRAFEAATVREAMEHADRASGLTAFAMEAISLADRTLGEDGFVRRHVAADQSRRNANAGRARHAKTDALKASYRRFHACQSAGISKAESARRFLSTLSESERKLLSRDNAVRTLTESLKE